MDHEYLINGLDDEIVKAYYEYMVDIAVIFGAERNRAEQEMKESLEFEIQLANVSFNDYRPKTGHLCNKKSQYVILWIQNRFQCQEKS